MKHKSDDYKTIAVKYYLNNKDSMDKVCKIFNCKKSTLKDWIEMITLLYEIKQLWGLTLEKTI